MDVESPVTFDVADSASMRIYDLECADCAFELTVKGRALDAIDVAETHREKYGHSCTDHYVDLELRRLPDSRDG